MTPTIYPFICHLKAQGVSKVLLGSDLMLKVIAAVLFTLPIGSGQVIGIVTDFPPQLKTYLELTDDQVTSIKKANADLNTFRTTKLQTAISSSGRTGARDGETNPRSDGDWITVCRIGSHPARTSD